MRVKPTWLKYGGSTSDNVSLKYICEVNTLGVPLWSCGYGDGQYSSRASLDWHAGRGFGFGPWTAAGVAGNGSGYGIHNENR